MDINKADLSLRDHNTTESIQTVKIVVLDSETGSLPPFISFKTGSTYSVVEGNLNDLIKEYNLPPVVILVQQFGLWPCWRFHTVDENIPEATKVLHVIRSDKDQLIAVLRTETKDQPLVVDVQENDSRASSTIMEILQPIMESSNIEIGSVKIYGKFNNVTNEKMDLQFLRELPTFPTVFFLCTESKELFNFKTKIMDQNRSIPLFQMAINQCKQLIEDSSSIPVMSLQCIHISRALLHLLLNLIDHSTVHGDKLSIGDLLEDHGLQWTMDQFSELLPTLSSRDISGPSLQQLKDILNGFFIACCNDYPGAAAVRQSYDAYQSMSVSDLQEWKDDGGHGEWEQELSSDYNLEELLGQYYDEYRSQRPKDNFHNTPPFTSSMPSGSNSLSKQPEALTSDEEMAGEGSETEGDIEMEDEANTSISIAYSGPSPPIRSGVSPSMHPRTDYYDRKISRRGDSKSLSFPLPVKGASTSFSEEQIPMSTHYPRLQPPSKLYGHVDEPRLTGYHGQPIEDPVMNTLTSRLPGQGDLAWPYVRQAQISSPPSLQETGNNTSNQGHFDNTGGDTLGQHFHHRAAYSGGPPPYDNDNNRALSANPQGLDSTARVGNCRCGLTTCTNCYPSHSPTNGYYHPSVSPTMRRYDESFHFGTTSINPPVFQSHRAEVAGARVRQHDAFDHDQPSTQIPTSPPQYQSYGLTPLLPQTSHRAPVEVSVLSTHLPTSSTDNTYDPSLFPLALQVHADPSNSHVVLSPVRGGGTIRSLQELMERKLRRNSVENGAASLLLQFYEERRKKWEKWKTEVPQEPREQRRGSMAQSSPENDTRDSICARIDSGIETVELAEVALDTLDAVLLKVREETTCKKGEEMLRSLVKFYAGNTEGSLSWVIRQIYIKLEEGRRFLALDESTNSNLQGNSNPSTSRSKQNSTGDSLGIVGPPDPQQNSGNSLLVQRNLSAQLERPTHSKIRGKNLRLGIDMDGDSGSMSSWDTSSNVLRKLSLYLLQNSPSYKCFACDASGAFFSTSESLSRHMSGTHLIHKESKKK